MSVTLEVPPCVRRGRAALWLRCSDHRARLAGGVSLGL